ncbi:MAG: RDD family protein [Myxococcales bacterium]|nr:RDD family protein [Myxococcales bacterium]
MEVTPIDTVATIEAPEHVRFDHRLAGPAQRGAAFLVDALIRVAVVLLLWRLIGTGLVGDDAPVGVLLVAAFLLEWGYFVAFEMLWSGRSPGKRVFGLRVVKQDGRPIGFVDSVLRNLLRAVDYLPAFYALGALASALDPQFRRLGDQAAGTLVVRVSRARSDDRVAVEPPPTAAELAALPPRPALSADELRALEDYLRRVGTLSPAREDELADLIAPALAARMGGLTYGSASRFLALLYHRATVG